MKALKVVCGILAGFLSAVLVFLLIAAPILLSVLDVLKPETITNAFSSLIAGATSSAKEEEMVIQTVSTEGVRLTLLADGDTAAATGSQNIVSSLITPEMVKDMLGVEVDANALQNILKSEAATNTMNDILGAYTEGLTGSGKGEGLTAETIKKIASDNIDKIVDVLQAEVPAMAEKPKEELKVEIQTAIENNADNIVAALPKAEDLKEELLGSLNAAVQKLVNACLWCIGNKGLVNWICAGAFLLLCVLIFFLRFWGFKGLRQLAIDMFVGGGIGLLLSVALKVAGTKIPELMKGQAAMASGVITTVTTALGDGMLWRTVVIVVAGGVSLAGYIVLKKVRKAAAEEEVSFQALMEEVEMADAEEETVVAEEETVVAEEETVVAEEA